MATKPVAWQEQGPVYSLDEWVNESWAQGEVSATISQSSPPQDKKAPKAEPEEDIDVLEHGAPDKTLAESQRLSRTERVDATKLENQDSTRICLCTPRETQEVVTELEQVCKKLLEVLQAQEESEKPAGVCEDAFPPPPPPFSDLSTDEYFEREGFSSLEGEVAEWISDVEIISDPAEDLISPNKEWAKTTQLTELIDQEVDSTSEEMTEDNMAAEENDTQLHFLSDGFDNSEREYNTSGAAHHFPSDSNNSEDVYAVRSPPFADESEEEEEVSMNITSCQQQWGTLDIRCKPFQPSYSANVSVSTEQDPTSALPAVPSAEQQDELLPQSQCGFALSGANQEAAQQVRGRGSPPLSTVAMELSNQGGAASHGFGCVVSVRERHSRTRERTEAEGKQTGREERQEESGLERSKEHGRGLLRYSETLQIQEAKTEIYSCGVSFKYSKHNRMENDSCDDSQSDSGVSADFSPCSTLEGNSTISTGTPATVSKETPIEREIRRAIEREHSLRRSRGLRNPPTSPEYVEIPLRKTILCQSLTTKSERCQGKDRQFAGKKMQHEILEEAQREEDLVKLGKVPGFYDKGTVRQLKERKQLFEAFQKPSDSTLIVSTRSKTVSWSSASDISTLENQEAISSETSTIDALYVERRQNVDLLSPTESLNLTKGGDLINSTLRGLDFSEGTCRQVIILESNLSVPAQKLYHAKREAEPVTTVESRGPNISFTEFGGHDGINEREQEKEEEEVEVVAPKENPFFKLRSSTNLVKVEQDIRETQEREKELRKQRISLYGETGRAKGGEGGGGGRPAIIEAKSPTLSSSSLNGLAVPDIPGSSPRRGAGPSAAHQSDARLGTWPPAKVEEESTTRQEVLQSPRTPRQKTPLVQRWESGLVNGHNKEDN
ncbi:uncharacterized protein si:ch211-207j7.2 [Xiphias gladius]|uniref:uncharacterized protein si:ch211-207j7.2 n=1 Tax=Xiphias gladius TaxID=8245 RepID=UPI001A980B21|nr:uncharacterized protein si:ch211-207j7.2 [Xiphias gladius]XP_040003062.1 uncharacterized protein si:ch211-207j7.2 [Xiphias gladius]